MHVTIGLSWTLLVLVAPVGRLGTMCEPLRRYKVSVWAKRDVKLHAHVQHVWSMFWRWRGSLEKVG